jgi:hypothetical protein
MSDVYYQGVTEVSVLFDQVKHTLHLVCMEGVFKMDLCITCIGITVPIGHDSQPMCFASVNITSLPYLKKVMEVVCSVGYCIIFLERGLHSPVIG